MVQLGGGGCPASMSLPSQALKGSRICRRELAGSTCTSTWPGAGAWYVSCPAGYDIPRRESARAVPLWRSSACVLGRRAPRKSGGAHACSKANSRDRQQGEEQVYLLGFQRLVLGFRVSGLARTGIEAARGQLLAGRRAQLDLLAVRADERVHLE